MMIPGRVKDGVVILDNGARIPEGQQVTVLIPDGVPVAPLYASKRFVKLDLSEGVRSRLLKAVRSEAGLVRRARNGIVSNGRRRR